MGVRPLRIVPGEALLNAGEHGLAVHSVAGLVFVEKLDHRDSPVVGSVGQGAMKVPEDDLRMCGLTGVFDRCGLQNGSPAGEINETASLAVRAGWFGFNQSLTKRRNAGNARAGL